MKFNSSLLVVFILLSSFVFAAPPVEEGKSIFMSRCASCHNINKDLTGPALAGLQERRSMDWIINFIQSSQSMVKGGDKTAADLFEKFNNIPMPDHKDLTAENIKNVVEYIKTESKAEEVKAPFSKPGKLRPNYLPISINDYHFFIGFFVLVGLLILALLFAVQVKEYERKMDKQY